MKIRGVKEVSGLLANFEFSKVRSEVVIKVSRYGSDEDCYDAEGNFIKRPDFDTIRVKIYDEANPDADSWDSETWSKFITTSIAGFAKRRKEYEIDSVFIEYWSYGCEESGEPLCMLCWDGEAFGCIFIDSFTPPIFSDAAIWSSDEAILKVCAEHGIPEDCFERVA